MNIIELFQQNVLKTPNKIAIVFKDQKYTYKILQNDIKRYTSFLESFGIVHGSHVMLFLENSYEYIVLMLSIASIGGVMIPVSRTLKAKALQTIINTTESKFIILNSLDKSKLLNKINSIMFIDIVQIKSYKYSDENMINFNNVSKDDDYILTMTSGSTGNPKLIVFTQETKIRRSLLGAKDLYNLTQNEVILIASPLYHSMGQRLVLLPLLIGGTAVLLQKFYPKTWLETIEKYNVTFTIAIASHLNILVEKIDGNFDISSLKSIVSSSSLLRKDIKQKCISKFQCEFYECYGTSEVGIATNLGPTMQNLGSVGKALAFVDIKIVNDKYQKVENGTIGEIIIKTKTAFSKYYNAPKKTKESIKDGFFCTGDLGYIDNDGYLYFCGRKKELIIVGGTNVYPKDIEDIISSVSGVKECSVIGIKDSYFGEVILAILVVDDIFSLKDVRMACLENLADFQQPMGYEIVEALPKNSLGKVMKFELENRYKDLDLTKSLRKMWK